MDAKAHVRLSRMISALHFGTSSTLHGRFADMNSNAHVREAAPIAFVHLTLKRTPRDAALAVAGGGCGAVPVSIVSGGRRHNTNTMPRTDDKHWCQAGSTKHNHDRTSCMHATTATCASHHALHSAPLCSVLDFRHTIKMTSVFTHTDWHHGSARQHSAIHMTSLTQIGTMAALDSTLSTASST